MSRWSTIRCRLQLVSDWASQVSRSHHVKWCSRLGFGRLKYSILMSIHGIERYQQRTIFFTLNCCRPGCQAYPSKSTQMATQMELLGDMVLQIPIAVFDQQHPRLIPHRRSMITVHLRQCPRRWLCILDVSRKSTAQSKIRE